MPIWKIYCLSAHRFAKRQASKAVRRASVGNGGLYKRVYDSYSVVYDCDLPWGRYSMEADDIEKAGRK